MNPKSPPAPEALKRDLILALTLLAEHHGWHYQIFYRDDNGITLSAREPEQRSIVPEAHGETVIEGGCETVKARAR